MAREKSVDLRSDPALEMWGPRFDGATIPYSIEAEQGILGCLLFDNEAFYQLPPALRAGCFYEPLHAKFFDSISSAINMGMHAEPLSLSEEFRAHGAFKEIGGLRYLADLVDAAPPAYMAATLGSQIVELFTRRELVRLGTEIVRSAMVAENSQGGATEIIAETERSLLGFQLSDRRLELTSAPKAADDVIAWVQNTERQTGIITTLEPLDKQLGPLLPGDLILVGGRPSMGKSALASHIALGVADPDEWAPPDPKFEMLGLPRQESAGVIELNGEMSVGQMTRRHLADIGFKLYGDKFPTYKQIRDRRVSEDQMRMLISARDVFARLPIKQLKRTGLRVSQLRSIVRRQTSEWAREGIPLGLVVVDHVGLLSAEGRTSGRYEAQMEIAIAMKELADDVGAVVMALIQLSREVERREDKRPQLSDLRDAGGWEENADAVLFPFRDSYYAQKEAAPPESDLTAWSEWDRRRKSQDMEIIIAKLREGESGHDPKLWAGMGWNAIRGTMPEYGDLI